MGDKLQIAKRPGESHKHNPHLRVGKLPYLRESRKHNPRLMVGKSPQLSEFLTSGDLPGANINISLSSVHFIYYLTQCGSGR
eukprot:CCRYP_015539-RD/>CCRYP_015539-RD protein AED:0.43 eAED:0.54 QI:15/0.5/0.66/1/0/0/3/0/81